MDKLYCQTCGVYCAYVKAEGIKGLFLQKGATHEIFVTCAECLQPKDVHSHPGLDELKKIFKFK